MKKIIAGFIVIATITFTAQAQVQRKTVTDSSQTGTARLQHGKGQHNMMGNLQLTDDQKQQAKTINEDFKTEMAALKSSSLSATDLAAKKEEIKKERKNKFEAILSQEQKDKLSSEKASHQKGDHAKANGRMQDVKQQLALTDDQVQKLQAQRETMKSKAEAIKSNQSLSQDDKKAQMKTMRDENRNTFKSILTPDQLKKWDEMKQKRGGKAVS